MTRIEELLNKRGECLKAKEFYTNEKNWNQLKVVEDFLNYFNKCIEIELSNKVTEIKTIEEI